MIIRAIENYKSSLILQHLEKVVIAFRNICARKNKLNLGMAEPLHVWLVIWRVH